MTIGAAPGRVVTVPIFQIAGCKTANISADLHLLAGSSLRVFGSSFTMNGTLTLDGGNQGSLFTEVKFHDTATLGGSGTLPFANGGGSINTAATGQTLTIGGGITVRNGTSGAILSSWRLISAATVVVEGPGATHLEIIWNQEFINRGAVHLNSGVLSLRGQSPGDWTNLGHINVNGGIFNIGGRYRQSDIGSFTRTGGTVNAQGTLVGNLTLDARTGSWNGGGNLVGGRLTLRDGGGTQFLMFAGGPQQTVIGSGVTVRTGTGNGSFSAGSAGSRLVINGAMGAAGSRGLSLNVPNMDLRGQITVASGANLSLGGTLNIDPTGTLTVGGAGQVFVNRGIVNRATTPGRVRSVGTAQYLGGTAAAAPKAIEAAGQDRGPTPDGYRDNFAMGLLRVQSPVRLADATDNSLGAGAEAVYVDSLFLTSQATLDLNGHNLYARVIENQGGTITGGNVTLVPDSGPIAFAAVTSGRIAAAGQRDDWTFFGRAGQTVSAVMNPTPSTTPGSPGALQPTLQIGRLSLLSPGGVELGVVQGQVSTPPNVTLPADGTYTLRVQAPLNDPNRTGVYNLALYDPTAETRPLVLNTVKAGSIETPFARDRWAFSLSAGQQVQFDLIAAQTSGFQFTLDGPDGYVAFDNLTDDSTLITIPGGRGAITSSPPRARRPTRPARTASSSATARSRRWSWARRSPASCPAAVRRAGSRRRRPTPASCSSRWTIPPTPTATSSACGAASCRRGRSTTSDSPASPPTPRSTSPTPRPATGSPWSTATTPPCRATTRSRPSTATCASRPSRPTATAWTTR